LRRDDARAGLDVMVLEKAGQVGAVWRRHYDRLHLHTDRKPFRPARDADAAGLSGLSVAAQMVSYLESYAARFQIKPVFNTKVARCGVMARDGLQTRHLMRFGAGRGGGDGHCGRALPSVLAGIG